MKVFASPGPVVEPTPALVRVPSTKTIVADPTDRKVRILVAGGQRIDAPGPQVVTGDVIQAASLITIIFFDSPCTLDIEGAASMQRAWQYAGDYNSAAGIRVVGATGNSWVRSTAWITTTPIRGRPCRALCCTPMAPPLSLSPTMTVAHS
jgi:hypothetical protein